MEYLCENYPMESILFFKRSVQMTVITGTSLFIPTASCIYATWDSLHDSDHYLRYWSIIRVLLFLMQLPLRYRVWTMLQKAQNERYNFEIYPRLRNIMKTREWRTIQCCSGFVSTWVCITLILTLFMGTKFPTEPNKNFEGYLSPCLHRICWISIGLLIVHLLFTFAWLQNVSNTCEQQQFAISIQELENVSSVIKFDSNNVNHKTAFDQCSICLEEYNRNDDIRQFTCCHHSFHAKCIDEWVKKQPRCPLCNRNLKHQISNDNVFGSDVGNYRNYDDNKDNQNNNNFNEFFNASDNNDLMNGPNQYSVSSHFYYQQNEINNRNHDNNNNNYNENILNFNDLNNISISPTVTNDENMNCSIDCNENFVVSPLTPHSFAASWEYALMS